MLFGVLTSVTLAVLASQVAAEPLRRPYKFHVAKMSVRNLFGLEGRQLSGYKPDEEFCTEKGDTCAEACGDDFDQACFKPLVVGGRSKLQPAYAHGSRSLCVIDVIGGVDVAGDLAGDPVSYHIHHIFGDDNVDKDSGDGPGYIFGYVFRHVFGGYNVGAEDVDTDIRDNPTDDIERKPAAQLHYGTADNEHHLLHAGQHHHFTIAASTTVISKTTKASNVTRTATTLSSATKSSAVDETLIKAPSITVPGAGGAGQQTATASDESAVHASEGCTTYTTISVATLTLTESSSVPEPPATADSTPTSGPPAPILANAARGHGPVFGTMLLAAAGIAGALL
ncbi:hypothetical protein DL764_006522 [Monosporascus ibericus]|uniref:Superoxide dismutase copper/zinc binding domain-containing protein n=1 Tax=Monosporascus ibericus TaxID=155417 RepID=A0A4Q4T884_9PEZI|nr:hypothetical protein DL764_006522 [Monosporascus ibericus]